MNLNQLAKQAHATATKRGFFPADSIHRNIIEGMKELGELSDAVISDRNALERDLNTFEELVKMGENELAYQVYKNTIKDTIGQELAGALITILSIGKELGLDVDRYVRLEMMFNELRAEIK